MRTLLTKLTSPITIHTLYIEEHLWAIQTSSRSTALWKSHS